MKPLRIPGLRNQRGMATMLVAILLLGILTVTTLFALSVGVFEQRTAINDNRARLVHAAAEAGLNQGIEFFKRNKQAAIETWLYPTSPATIHWVLCTSDETSFPCGAETDTTRRARLWRYTDSDTWTDAGGGTHPRTDASGTTDIDERRVLNFESMMQASPYPQQAFTTTGPNAAFSVDYDVGALLCLIDDKTGLCQTTLDANNHFRGQYAVTLVSKARLSSETLATGTDSENTSATHKVTIALFPAINGIPNAPVIASGSVTGIGSFEIVPNENAGATTARNGIPISIWSNQDASYSDDNGAAQSCHLGEWLTNAGSGSSSTFCGSTQSTVDTSAGATCDGITVCSKCKCDGLAMDRGMISGKSNGNNGNVRRESDDILDIEATAPTSSTSTSSLPNPSCDGTHFFFPFQPCDLSNFPLDDSLFEYVFGIENSAEADSSLEAYNGNNANYAGLDRGAAEMLNSSAFTTIATSADCAQLGTGASGMYYIKPGVSCHPNTQVGTPYTPVGIVSDGDFDFTGGNQLFGMIFVRRYLSNGATVNGNAHIAASTVIYGAVVTEGSLVINGSTQVIYNEQVLKNLANNPASGGIGVVPGSWSDDVTLN